jgi:hypothetical protein
MLAYLPAIGRALPEAKPFAASLDLDGVTRQVEAVQIVVGNTRRYASVTSMTPDALVDDGKLDVCVLTPGNPLSAAQQLTTLVLRNRPSSWTAVTDRVGRLTVRATEVIPLQADGGRVKQKKIEVSEEGVLYEFTVRAQELTALIPRDYSGDLFQNGLGQAQRTEHPPVERTKGKKWYRVMSVGIDTVSAARERDGRVMTIQIGPKTRAENERGDEASLSAFLSSLTEGQLIQVKGKKDKKQGVITAKRLRLRG